MPDRHSFCYVDSWQRMTPDAAAAVRAFWTRERANVEGEAAGQRVRQIVLRVFSGDGELAAVSTAEPRLIPRLMQPMYYYRCFVGADWRGHKLIRPLLLHSFNALERWARERSFPCIGLVLELENPGFGRALRMACWRAPDNGGYAFIGCSRRGFDLRVRYFRGARLKSSEEVKAMMRQG